MSRLVEAALDPERMAACREHDAQMRRRGVTRAARMVTTSAGITIGIAWERPAPQFSHDAERIQAALLERRTKRAVSAVQRVADAIWRWL